jgi:myo-inositol catabolism protein IolC
MTTLTVQRDNGWADKLRKYRILVDGVEIGRLGENEKLFHQVGEGLHVIDARVDWCGSRPLKFEARSEDLEVTVKSSLRGWRVFLALFYVIFNRHRYLTLDLRR